MRIMFFHSSMQAGGAERMISALANYYAERDITVAILVIDDLPSDYPLHDKIRFINLFRRRKSKNIVRAIKNNLRLIKLCRKTLREERPDCIICFGINTLVFALLAKGFMNIKIIGSERTNPNYDKNGFWKKMKIFASPFADGYIFQTNAVKDFYPVAVRRKSEIIPNGLFMDYTQIDIIPISKRNPSSMCAVGRLEYVKGYDTLIRAFAIFVRRFPTYELTIYGEGCERIGLETLIRDLDLEGKVILAGRVENILEEISKHKVFVLSSRFEGMPNALIEGMACGCACISTDCNFGPRELISDGESGILVAVEDINAMAGALEQLASDDYLLQKLANNAVKIGKTHSIERIAEKYLTYIRTVVQQ